MRPWEEGWLEAYRLYCVHQGRAPATIRTNLYAARAFVKWCEEYDVDPASVDKLDIARHIEWRQAKKQNQHTIIRQLGSVRFFYQFMVDTDRSVLNPTDGLKLRLPKAPKKQPFSTEELQRLIDHVDTPRNRAIVLVLIDTGMRLGELAGMRAEHIDFDHIPPLVRVEGKGYKRRDLALGSEVVRALRDHIGDQGSGAIWKSTQRDKPLDHIGIAQMLWALGKRAAVKKVHPHRFRTTFACTFLKLTHGDVQACRILMGHEKIETTLAYAAAVEAELALKQQTRFSIADLISNGHTEENITKALRAAATTAAHVVWPGDEEARRAVESAERATELAHRVSDDRIGHRLGRRIVVDRRAS